MISRLFHAVDDFLIDRIFQPICDTFRSLFGWTKEAPMGISFAAAIISFMPMCVASINDEIARTLGWMMAAWIIYCSWLAIRLIRKGTAGKDGSQAGSATMDAARVELFVLRIGLLLLVALMIQALIWLIRAIPTMSFTLSTFLIGIIFVICILYFQACTDLPPGKTVLAKTKERIAEWLAKPVLTDH